MGAFAQILGLNLNSQVSIHSIQDETSFATGIGGLVSVLRVDGLMRLMGRSPEIRAQMDQELLQMLAPLFQKPGHILQWSFARDPRWSRFKMDRHIARGKNAARRMHLDEELVDAYRSIESRFVPEVALMAIWTLPSALLPHEIKEQTKQRDAALDMKMGPWQVPNLALPALPAIHSALINTLVINLEKAGVAVRTLNTQEAVRAWRQAIDPENTDDTVWDQKNRPILNERTAFGVPTIREQILPYRAVTHAHDIVECNGVFRKTLSMSFGPAQKVRFADLISLMSHHLDLPWSYTVTLAPARGNFYQGIMTGAVAAILSLTNKSNSLITDASDYVADRARKGDYLLDMRVLFSTWGDSADECLRNARRLELAVRAWGSITVDGVNGDPIPYWLSTIPGLRTDTAGTIHTPNFSDSLAFLPLATPASPWEEGPLLLRSPDGKEMPVRIGSALQNDFVIAMMASPGSGKSVLVALLLMAHLLEGGHDELPPAAIIDIGYSSLNNGKNLQDSLPAKLRHQVNVMVLRQTREHAVNPFDLPLGFRDPLPQHRARLLELLVMVCTPVGMTTPPDDMYETLGYLLDMAYKRYSDKHHDGSPKRWSRGQSGIEEIEDFVAEGIQSGRYADGRPHWWRVVDDLFAQKQYALAAAAQRYAVPLIGDLIQFCRDPEVVARLGKIGKSHEASESLLDRVARYLESAVQEYPILSNATVQNMQAARVNILDLQEVTAGTGPDAAKRTSVMYLAARFAATGHWYVNPDEDPQRAPEQYREYHRKEMKKIYEQPKFVVYDEFHRTEGAEPPRRVIDRDAREGRKYNIRMALSSQRLDDFDPKFLAENCSTKYILSAPEDPKDLIQRFQLSAAEAEMLPFLLGPSSLGSNILCLWNTKRGRYRMMLSDPVPLEWLWAFSTTSEDRGLLSALQQYVTPAQARKLAAARFGTSAKSVIEKRRGEAAEGETEAIIAKEIIDAWNQAWAAETKEKFFANS
jgi:intracellular multiplication protein IcmB